MLPAIFVFFLGAGTVIGVYYAVTTLPETMARRRLDQRLMDVSFAFGPTESGSDEPSGLVKQQKSGPLPVVDRLVSRTRTGSLLKNLIDQSGVQTTPSAIVVLSLGSGLFFALAAQILIHVPYLPIIIGLVGAAVPTFVLLYKRSARMRKFEEQFPEALDLLSRALRAGHAFQTALGMVAEEMKEPVGPEFKKTFDQQNFGLPLRDVLNEMTQRMPILDVRFFVTAVLIQRDTGGNLSEILDNLSNVVRERFKIRRQVRVHTAHGRFTAFVLLSLPAALAMALSALNPEHMALLFHEHLGQMMLVVALIMQFIGFIWIRQVIKIEV